MKGYIPGVPSTIDPCIFIDDDGKAYVYAGGGGKGCWGGKLKDDNWLQLETKLASFPEIKGNFHEAPFVFKKDGLYYLTYSDGHKTELGGNQLLYATSKSPLGPWEAKGVYMYPHGEETAHGSIVQFKGKWYQFYHTANYSGAGALRSVCFDEVTFTDDGKINPVHTWDSLRAERCRSLRPTASLSCRLKTIMTAVRTLLGTNVRTTSSLYMATARSAT